MLFDIFLTGLYDKIMIITSITMICYITVEHKRQ